jgi:hypothetical protein
MAIYVPIRKTFEDGSAVEYCYTVSKNTGRLRVDKKTGDFIELESLPFEEAAGYVARVIYKLKKHWAKGEFPDATSWSA